VEVLRVLSGQYVVVNVMVVVVPPVVQMDVPVEVIVRFDVGVVVADVVIDTGLLVEDVVAVLDAVEEDCVADGVQPGRVNESAQFPVPHSTMQFFSQAASPLVLLVCQHKEPPSSPNGKYPAVLSLQLPPWPIPFVHRTMMLLVRESPAQKAPLGLPVQMIVPVELIVNCALATAAEVATRIAEYFIFIERSRSGRNDLFVLVVGVTVENERVLLNDSGLDSRTGCFIILI